MTILCYHSVEPGWASPLAVEPGDFARQCAWLASHRHVLPLSIAVDRLDRAGRMPGGAAALTFDDGFAGLYEYALPSLLRHQLPATVFVVAQTVAPEGLQVDWVDTPPDHPLTTLTREQILEMQAAGVDFQSHSLAHHDLTTLPYEACVEDLRKSRELLESILDRPVRRLAYPRGRHDLNVRRAAAEAGYTQAFGLPERREPLGAYAIPRVGVYRGNTVRTLAVKASRPYLTVRTRVASHFVRRGRAFMQRLP